MRHGASLIVAMEGMNRTAFRIAKEIAQNSRSGLTIRFLSKKLEVPEEEVEYLVDLHDRLFFGDLTKIKLVPEGVSAVKRVSDGLENRGDVPSLIRRIRSLNAHDFRRFEEQLGIERMIGKGQAAEALLERYYRRPESVVEYVATRGFSQTAQEVFDLLWQSKDGIMPVSVIRAGCVGARHKDSPVRVLSEYEVEQALWELFRGFALFEMFRFDAEDRLVRAAGLLAEIRQSRERTHARRVTKAQLRAYRGPIFAEDCRGLDLSDRVCRLVAAIAARAVRLRGDGDLFREDQRRLSEVVSEDTEPSVNTCLWIAEGVGWLARVDNELRASQLDTLIGLNRISRHRVLFDWLAGGSDELSPRRALTDHLDAMKPDVWYPVMDFLHYVMRLSADTEAPVLKNVGGHWQYVSPHATPSAERALVRSLEEAFLWLGVADRAEADGQSLFRVTALGRFLLRGDCADAVAALFPEKETELVVQPNFDIVAPMQDADPLLTVPLDQFALRVSSGQAAVYHLTKDSFTRALQEGHNPDAFVDFLLRHNRGGELPSNVAATLDDWRGGMKRVRLRTVQVLESDDPLIIADLLHRRRFSKHLRALDARRVAAFSHISRGDLAKELEKEGFVVD